ncbi:MAG: TonB-dependent receptor [Opitutaceae bacterium]|nr:TonB-dependent receptor [Opitutaceae bacterium]
MFARIPFSTLVFLPAALAAQTAAPPRPAGPAAADGPFITLGRVEVAATALGARSTDLLTSVTVVGSDQLEHESVDYPLELLNKVPGITLTDFNQGVITADVSMRGFNGEGASPHVRLLVDGIPHNLNNGYNDLGAVFPLEFERVEVVKGTADARFGLNAVAGSLNVHTHQSFAGQKLKVMAGDFGTLEAQALAGFRHGGFSQTYFAGYRESEGYRKHSDLSKHTLAGKWFYSGRDDRWRIGLSARVHAFDGDAPGYLTRAEAAATPRASPAFSQTDGGTIDNEQLSLHGDAQLAPGFTASLKAYRHEVQRHRYVRFTAAVAQQERVEDEVHTGGTFAARWKPVTALPLTVDAGAEYHEQDALNQRFNALSRVRTATTRDHRYTLENQGAFVSADVRPAGWLRLVGAVRADRFDGEFLNRANGTRTPILGFGTIWQPKVSAAVQPTRTVQLYGSYGRAFQIGAGAGAYGTKPLEASKNDGYEAGLRLTPAPGLAVRLALWRQTATDEVRLKPDNSGDSENIGETKRDGADLEVTWRAHRRVSLWAAYTRQQGTFVNPGGRPADAALRGREIDHIPEFMLKAGVDASLADALTLAVSVLGQGDYQLLPANTTEQFGDHTLVHADLRYRWRKATLGLHVKNVFDQRHAYVWHDGAQALFSPGDARAVLGTVAFEF